MQANSQGKYDAANARQNAAMEVEGFRDEREIAQNENRDYWRKVSAVKGQNMAAMAANGIDVNIGSAARLQSDVELQAGEDATNMYKNQYQRQRGRLINASNYVQEAKAARARGKAALVSSVFGAATSLLGGAAQAGQLRANAAPPPPRG